MKYKKINDAFILAAGRGSRLMPITKNIPKGMIKYNQTTLILNGIKKLRKYLNKIHISVGYKGPILAKYLIEQEISTIVNTNNRGNSWWIFNSIFKNLDKPIFVLTCDNVTDVDFNKIEKDYYKLGSPLCMLVATKPIQGLEGDYIFKRKNIIKSLSRKKVSKEYCTGIQILNPKKINEKITNSNNFNLLWNKLIKIKQLYVSNVYPKKWFTVDNIQNYKKLKKNIF